MSETTTYRDYETFVRHMMNADKPTDALRSSYALGLVCEIGEVTEAVGLPKVDIPALTNELGDVLHYIAGNFMIFRDDTSGDLNRKFYDAVAVQLSRKIARSDSANYLISLLVSACQCGDMAKKLIGHGKPIDQTAFVGELTNCLRYLSEVGFWYGITLQDMMNANVAKLKGRHPGGVFSNAYHFDHATGAADAQLC